MRVMNYRYSAKEHLCSGRLGEKLNFEAIPVRKHVKKSVWFLPTPPTHPQLFV